MRTKHSGNKVGVVGIVMALVVMLMAVWMGVATAAPDNPSGKAVMTQSGRATFNVYNEEYKTTSDTQGSRGGESPYCVPSMMYLTNRMEEAVSGGTIVKVTSLSQLSALTSGASVYYAKAGERILIDPHGIATSVGDGTTTAAITTFTGVTIFGAQANAQTDKKTFTVELFASRGDSVTACSGNTIVYVYPYPGSSGATEFGGSGAYAAGVQTILTTYTTNGSTGTYAVGKVSDWELNRIGENKTWRMENNSGASLVPVAKHVTN